jgi:hypothetical protein
MKTWGAMRKCLCSKVDFFFYFNIPWSTERSFSYTKVMEKQTPETPKGKTEKGRRHYQRPLHHPSIHSTIHPHIQEARDR